MTRPERDDPKDSAAGGRPSEDRPLRPTVLPPAAGSRKKARASGAGTKASATTGAPPVTQPTMLPGHEPRRVQAGPADLKRLSPGATTEVIARARELLASVIVDKLSQRKAILWGHELQKSYADLVAGTLSLSQAAVLKKADGYLNRLMDILGSIDLMAVAGHADAGLARMFRRSNRTIDTPEELRAAQAELDQLVGALGVALDELLDLRDKLEGHSRRIEAIGLEVEAAALAALFLSESLQQGDGGLAQRFAERSMSLTQSLAQIRSSDSMRATQIEHPLRMVSAVQNVVLVMMPGLLGGIASALTLMSRKSLTPTQAGELTYQLREILQQLQN